MKIKLNADLAQYKKGEIIEIEDKNGMPVESYWRNRLKESEIDNCITIVTKAVSEPVKQEKKPVEAKQEEKNNNAAKKEEVKDDSSK